MDRKTHPNYHHHILQSPRHAPRHPALESALADGDVSGGRYAVVLPEASIASQSPSTSLWGGLPPTRVYPAATLVSQRLFLPTPKEPRVHQLFPAAGGGVCQLVIKIWGRMGDGAARFCRDVAGWLSAPGLGSCRGGREDGFREGGQVEAASGSGQKFWQGVCGVPEREGHLLVTGGGAVSRGRPLCGVKGFEAWIG